MEKTLVTVTNEPSTFDRTLYDEEKNVGGIVCEEHGAAKVLTSDIPLFRATVHSEEGEWELAVSRDGWAYGDEKVLVALCPDCAAEVYTIQYQD